MKTLTFQHRRAISITITATVIGLFGFIAWLVHTQLGQPSLFTGATLLACLIGLILLGVRRRLPVIPLGSASTWTQIHLYLGFFCSAIYWMHVPSLIGSGVFECGLSIVFLTVTLSGFYGLYASRSIPKRLTAVEGQQRFDRVAWHRDQIAQSARGLLGEIEDDSVTGVLSSFYSQDLFPFFETRPSLAYVLIPSGGRRRKLISGLRELERYMENEGRRVSGKLAALVRRRDDLDYQFALQLRLRVWLVVHSFLSVVLLVGGIAHAVIALGYMH